jgi:hypothetical protein
VLASCGATLAGAFGSLLGILIPAAGLATLAAAVMAFVRPSDRSRQDAELADYLVALRNEVVHFRDLSKRDAVPTSARVEELIARVHALKMAGRSALGARSPRADASKRAG